MIHHIENEGSELIDCEIVKISPGTGLQVQKTKTVREIRRHGSKSPKIPSAGCVYGMRV